jgi:hypothetical protein
LEEDKTPDILGLTLIPPIDLEVHPHIKDLIMNILTALQQVPHMVEVSVNLPPSTHLRAIILNSGQDTLHSHPTMVRGLPIPLTLKEVRGIHTLQA